MGKREKESRWGATGAFKHPAGTHKRYVLVADMGGARIFLIIMTSPTALALRRSWHWTATHS